MLFFLVDQVGNSAAIDSQRSNDPNLVSLERNSFNFFEWGHFWVQQIMTKFSLNDRYAKMQLHSLPLSAPDLDFDIIAPRETSTRHVAAAAFYHCLGALIDFSAFYCHPFPINPRWFGVKYSLLIWIHGDWNSSCDKGSSTSQTTRSIRPINHCNHLNPDTQASTRKGFQSTTR